MARLDQHRGEAGYVRLGVNQFAMSRAVHEFYDAVTAYSIVGKHDVVL